jgi:hypothetical protein
MPSKLPVCQVSSKSARRFATPAERLREANAGDTGPPYRIAWAAKVEDPFLVNRRIHAAFTERRINPRRDFFRATAEDEPVARQLAIDPSSWRL